MAEGKAKAPVDGKRLANLEAGVSALAMALTANGIELEEGQDPVAQAIAIVKRWRELTLARAGLITMLAVTLGEDPNEITDPVDVAQKAFDALHDRISMLEAVVAAKPSPEEVNEGAVSALRETIAELEEDLAAMTNARNDLANQLAGEERPSSPPAAELADPEPEPDEIVVERPSTARDVGPTYGALLPGEIQALIESEANFELAFSNGQFEIIDFSAPPIAVGSKDLVRVDTTRVRLKDGVEIKGTSGVERVHGVGLLLEGVQIAYHTFEPVQIVRPQEHWRFAPVFG